MRDAAAAEAARGLPSGAEIGSSELLQLGDGGRRASCGGWPWRPWLGGLGGVLGLEVVGLEGRGSDRSPVPPDRLAWRARVGPVTASSNRSGVVPWFARGSAPTG